MAMTEILLLNEEDMIKCGVIDFAHCVDVLDEMFGLIGKGDYRMGGAGNSHGIPLRFPKETPFPNMPVDGPDRRFMAMPAYLGGRFNMVGMKWYGSNIKNPERGLPRSVLTVTLNDPDTCEPRAIMSGNLLSAARTGSVPGVAVRYLANKDASVCTCIGAGPISRSCFQGIYAAMKGSIRKLVVYDLFKDKSEAFCAWASEEFGVETEAADTLESAVRQGDIVSSATSSLKPVQLQNDWLRPGSVLIMTGRCFVDEEYFSSVKIAFDNPAEHQENYEEQLLLPEEERWVNGIGMQVYRMAYEGKLPELTKQPGLGDAVNGLKIREAHDDRVCFITFGMPTEDVAWGVEMYETARKKGIGTIFPLWPKEPLYK